MEKIDFYQHFEQEIHALDGMRGPHHSLEQKRDDIEREIEAIRESCVGTFRAACGLSGVTNEYC